MWRPVGGAREYNSLIADFIIEIVCEVFLTYTGEVIRFLVTFGRRKPRWNLYADETFGRLAVFTEISMWVGLAFWIAVFYLGYIIAL